MPNIKLANELMDTFMRIKNQQFHKIIEVDGYTHNEKLVLFILHDIYLETGENKILLSTLTDRIKLV